MQCKTSCNAEMNRKKRGMHECNTILLLRDFATWSQGASVPSRTHNVILCYRFLPERQLQRTETVSKVDFSSISLSFRNQSRQKVAQSIALQKLGRTASWLHVKRSLFQFSKLKFLFLHVGHVQKHDQTSRSWSFLDHFRPK